MGTSLSVFVPGLPLLRSPTVPHANAAVICHIADPLAPEKRH